MFARTLKMNKDIANAFTVPASSNQFATQEIESLEIGSGEPSFSAWPLRKQAEASDPCFWSACSSMCSAASTVVPAVDLAERSLSFPSNTDATFDLERNPANCVTNGSRGEKGHGDTRSRYCDLERGWRRYAATQNKRKDSMAFGDAWQAKRGACPENIARRQCTLECKLPGSLMAFSDRQPLVLEEYSLGSGDPYASGER
mmetsp:Transcript_9372/g.20119  ORF Transcript_9372/g.20119 Transcript_9372/m.20119 type:complete len:201 (-) Transcript_9372:314-916(-)